MSKSNLFFINILPSNDRRNAADFLKTLDHAISQSAAVGFDHTLVTIGDKRLDPWVVSQHALALNPSFKPIVATNPTHQHPVSLVKRLTSLQNFYGPRLSLNLITGSFIEELNSIGDRLSFRERNDRLVEFLTVCNGLISNNTTYNFNGSYYSVEKANIFPRGEKRELKFFVSGSFESSALQNLPNVYFVKNCRPLNETTIAPGPNSGLGIGICARPTDSEAESAAKNLFPHDRQGELLFSLALANNETPWNNWLKDYLKTHNGDERDFYLGPLKNYHSSAPYIVGSYDYVCERLKKYLALGYRFFLFDFHEGDFEHVRICIEKLKRT